MICIAIILVALGETTIRWCT